MIRVKDFTPGSFRLSATNCLRQWFRLVDEVQNYVDMRNDHDLPIANAPCRAKNTTIIVCLPVMR